MEIERHKEVLDVLPVTPRLIASLRETARLMTTHYSTQIEGNLLSADEVREVAEGKAGQFPGRERDEREVRNYFKAMEWIEQELEKGTDLSEDVIKEIHSLVYSGKNKQSEYRLTHNRVSNHNGEVIYMPPEFADVPHLMNEVTQWVNTEIKKGELPPPIIAGLAHYQFVTIHPYMDGNGRTARLLTGYILHRTGYGMKGLYSLEEYYAKNLQGYYDALDVGGNHNYYFGREQGDVTPFLEYFLQGMADSYEKVRERAEKANEIALIDEEHIFETRELRPQQRHTLSLFKRMKEIDVKDLSQHLGVSERSAYGLIKKWKEDKFIKIINPSKRSRTYGLEAKWESMLLESTKERLKALKKLNERGIDIDR